MQVVLLGIVGFKIWDDIWPVRQSCAMLCREDADQFECPQTVWRRQGPAKLPLLQFTQVARASYCRLERLTLKAQFRKRAHNSHDIRLPVAAQLG